MKSFENSDSEYVREQNVCYSDIFINLSRPDLAYVTGHDRLFRVSHNARHGIRRGITNFKALLYPPSRGYAGVIITTGEK